MNTTRVAMIVLVLICSTCQTVPCWSAPLSLYRQREETQCPEHQKERLRVLARTIPDYRPPKSLKRQQNCVCILRKSRHMAQQDCLKQDNVKKSSCKVVQVPAGMIKTKYGYNLNTRFSCCTGLLVSKTRNRLANLRQIS